ncbi:MAG: lysophospholipid acyltransferase family protein [Deltaproteobacteria bacterium]|nr:lysophospholipid acyltransferase family protein [Deltaproteobacteria bacterium]MBW2658218.1 lysophospholipid acyltransferase family protein [Deltaproteobacteria bacterium]
MKRNVMSTISLAVIPRLIAWLMRLWFMTCRVTVHNEEYFSPANDPDKVVIASFWHYTIIYGCYFLRKYPATVMVSASDDGEYIVRLAAQFGYNAVRGSSNHGGAGALKQLIKVVRQGDDNSAIVADGSQGPPRKAQPGAVLLSSMTGVPMVPMVWSASRYMTIHSWDRTAVPVPFSKIDFYFGEPIFVPRRVKGDDIERYRLQLEKSLNELYTKAWTQYNKVDH